jgi:hypothetical protein
MCFLLSTFGKSCSIVTFFISSQRIFFIKCFQFFIFNLMVNERDVMILFWFLDVINIKGAKKVIQHSVKFHLIYFDKII